MTRRFQVVKVEEPSEPLAAAMLRGLVATLEKHHNVRILDEAVAEAVKLSARFIPSRQLPDKGVSLLDTACARVSMSQASIPAPIEDRHAPHRADRNRNGSHRSRDRDGRRPRCRSSRCWQDKEKAQSELDALNERWAWRKGPRRPHQGPAQPGEARIDRAAVRGGCRRRCRTELAEALTALRALQGEEPLVHPAVDGQAVAEVVATWTGIPVGRWSLTRSRPCWR